jgi:hypothetical protein
MRHISHPNLITAKRSKLSLNKEALTQLGPNELGNVHGGSTPICGSFLLLTVLASCGVCIPDTPLCPEMWPEPPPDYYYGWR